MDVEGERESASEQEMRKAGRRSAPRGHGGGPGRLHEAGLALPTPLAVTGIVLGLALATSCFALVRQNRSLRERLRLDSSVERGERFAAMSGHKPGGGAFSWRFATTGKPTLVLVFSPTCGYCLENSQSWRTLVAESRKANVAVLGVDLVDRVPPHYLSEIGLRGAAVLVPDVETVVAYRFRLTPQTILLSSSGAVEGVWSGVLSGRRVQRIYADERE